MQLLTEQTVQLIFEWIVWGLLEGLGRLTKRLFGMPPSASGISEVWLGTAIAVIVLATVVYIVSR